MQFKITGIIIEKESRKAVPGLLVRAFDKDLFYSDLFGNTISRSNGTFSNYLKSDLIFTLLFK